MTSSLVSEELCGGVHGCTFHGLRDGMASHEAECAFVQLEPTLRAMQEQIGQLEEQIGDRDAQIDALNVRLRGREVRLTVRDLAHEHGRGCQACATFLFAGCGTRRPRSRPP